MTCSLFPRCALAVVVATLLSLSAPASANPLSGPWLNLVYDPALGMEAGVLAVHSLGEVVNLYDQALSRKIGWAPTTPGRWVFGVAGRFVQGVFLDLPIASLQVLVIHEVFGHGSRAQAWGAKPAYSFHVPFPYGWIFQDHSENSAETTQAGTGTRERNLPMSAGGIEAEYYSAYRVGLGAVALDGHLSHTRQLLYIAAKLVYCPSFLDPLGSDSPSNDVHNYVVEMADRYNRWRFVDRAALADRVRHAYAANFLDPTFWLSAYAYVVEYLGHGRSAWRLPMLPVGPVSLYASTRFALSPFGAEHYLDLFARFRGRTFTLYGRAVSSGLALAWGMGMKGLDLMRVGGVGINVAVDVWDQPEMLCDPSQAYVFNRPQRGGVNVAMALDWKLLGRVGLTGKLAWKTDGFLMGQPLGQGPYGWIGVAIYADADGALFKWPS